VSKATVRRSPHRMHYWLWIRCFTRLKAAIPVPAVNCLHDRSHSRVTRAVHATEPWLIRHIRFPNPLATNAKLQPVADAFMPTLEHDQNPPKSASELFQRAVQESSRF